MNESVKQEVGIKGLEGTARFIFAEGVLKYGLPLTLFLQIFGYLAKYGFTSAHLAENLTARNLLVFTLAVLLEGLFFALIIWYSSDRQFPRVVP